MVTSSTIAIIPARGGSKRIEKKNIVDFCGKPMIAWTIEAAIKSGCFQDVVVSTDDPETADVARQYGASVPFMRQSHADDLSPVSLATISTLGQLREELDQEPSTVVQLMANCPLRRAEHIAEALANFDTRRARAQISCFRFGWMNPWWAATLTPEMKPEALFPQAATSRSQDLPPLYCPTGAVWVARVAHLIQHQTFHTPDRIFWPMPWQPAVDIDDYEDLRMAELLFRMEQGSR